MPMHTVSISVVTVYIWYNICIFHHKKGSSTKVIGSKLQKSDKKYAIKQKSWKKTKVRNENKHRNYLETRTQMKQVDSSLYKNQALIS